MANLFDLIGFRLGVFGLQVQDLCYPVLGEDMMVTSDSFFELQLA